MKRLLGWLKNLGGLNIALLLTFGFFIWFHFQMIGLYRLYGSIPEGYAVAVVGATIGEAGICGWIRTTKERERRKHMGQEDNPIG